MSAVSHEAAVHDMSGLDPIDRNLERLRFIDRNEVNYVFSPVLHSFSRDL